jgi:hypothetical protein
MVLISVPGHFWSARTRSGYAGWFRRMIHHLLYVDHLEGDGARFFELACEQDLEGIICKPKTSPYPFTWIKVKIPAIRRLSGAGNGSIACSRNDSAKHRDGSVLVAMTLDRR